MTHEIRYWMQMLMEAAPAETETSIDQKLAALTQRHDELMHHWNTVIKPTEPPRIDWATANHDPTAISADDRWWADPEKGQFWRDQIYPLNQEIEQLQAAIKTRQRTAKLQGKRGTTEGFDTSEVLYHGTDYEFEVFDRKMARTAAHIYTSPDLETAEGYGDRVYAVYGRQEPQAVGYRSIRITDRKPGGGFSDSVIFANPDDLQIIEEIE